MTISTCRRPSASPGAWIAWPRLRARWETSGLRDRVVSLHRLDTRTEIKRRIAWVGWRWALRAWGRPLRLYVTTPASGQSIAQQLGSSMEMLPYMGCGLLSGRKDLGGVWLYTTV